MFRHCFLSSRETWFSGKEYCKYLKSSACFLYKALNEQKPPVWIMIVSLLMLLISSAWTMAAVFSVSINRTLASIMLATATASNISFLLAMLTAILLYSGLEKGGRLRLIMVSLFAIGIVSLVYTVVLFLLAFLTRYPLLPD